MKQQKLIDKVSGFTLPLAFKKLPVKLGLSIQEDYMRLYFPYVSQPKQHKQDWM